MTLAQAVVLVQQRKFEPRHLAQRFPDEAADLKTGLYGDLEGALAAAAGDARNLR